jgi:hypothetical protein
LGEQEKAPDRVTAMKTKRESISFEGMRVIADYNVGDQRIIVLERFDSAKAAMSGQKENSLDKKIPPIAARSTTAPSVGGSGAWLRGAARVL